MKSSLLLAAAAIALARRASASDLETATSPAPGTSPLVGASRADLEAAAAEIAGRRGCPPVLLASFIDIESNWSSQALNVSPGDWKGGGAWGLCQLLDVTAIALDDKHPTSDPAWGDLDPVRAPFALTAWPEINLQLGASLVVDLMARAGGDAYSVEWLSDLAALYNSNRRFADAPLVTRTVYVPRFLRAYSRRAGVA